MRNSLRYPSSSRALRAVLLIGACVAAVPVAAQIQSIERRTDNAQRLAPGLPQAPTPVLPRVEQNGAAPDTTGVWHFVRSNDPAAARRELARLQAAFPAWTPPADLLTNIARLENPGAAAPAADSGYARQLNEMAAGLRAHAIAGKEPALARLEQDVIARKDAGAGELLGWAYMDFGDLPRAQHWFERAEGWGAPAQGSESTARQGRVRAVAAQGRFEDAERLAGTTPALRTIISDQAAQTAQEAAKAGKWTDAFAAAAVAERNGQANTTAGLGWIALAAGSYPEAKRAFASAATEDATTGAILVLDQSQALAGEIETLCAARMQSDRHKEACANALGARALAAYRAEDWAQTIALDGGMQKLGVAQPGIGALAAWSHYRRGEYAVAARDFDTLYKGGADVADGLVLASIAGGQEAAIARRASTDPRIAGFYNAQAGVQALQRKKFQLAATFDDDKTSALRNIAAPELEAGAFYREKTGTPGQDSLRVTGLTVRDAYGWNGDRITLGMTDMRWRIGTPAPATPVGTQGIRRFAPTAGDVLYLPSLSWQHDTVEDRFTLTAGATPIGGAVKSVLPAGQAQWQHSGAAFITTLTVRAAPVAESLLSFAGLVDPVTGKTWGRVVDLGGQAAVTYLASETVALSGSVEAAALKGKDVAGNSRFGASLSLSYQFKPEGFDYVRIGPSYAYQHYAKNQFFFTYGNGGYYSPDQLHTLGGFLDVQSAEAKRWQIGARVSGGWTHKVEAAGFDFPLSALATRIGGARGSEFSVDSVGRASVLVSDHLRLGFYGRYTQAPSGKDKAVAVTLSLPLGPRAAVFSSDLPQVLDRSWP